VKALRTAWAIPQFFIDIVIVLVAIPVFAVFGRPTDVRNAMSDDGVALGVDDDDPGVDVDE